MEIVQFLFIPDDSKDSFSLSTDGKDVSRKVNSKIIPARIFFSLIKFTSKVYFFEYFNSEQVGVTI